MEKKLKIAFEKSILKWHEIVYCNGLDYGIDNCFLCQLYSNSGCLGCPINSKVERNCCQITPYEDWSIYLDTNNFPPYLKIIDKKSQKLAYKELVFLENLYCELLFEDEG